MRGQAIAPENVSGLTAMSMRCVLVIGRVHMAPTGRTASPMPAIVSVVSIAEGFARDWISSNRLSRPNVRSR